MIFELLPQLSSHTSAQAPGPGLALQSNDYFFGPRALLRSGANFVHFSVARGDPERIGIFRVGVIKPVG